MPEITRFYGIVIQMYVNEKGHNRPHIHAKYSGHKAVIYIDNFEISTSNLPATQLRMVLSWTKMYQDELLRMWETKKIGHIDPLK